MSVSKFSLEITNYDNAAMVDDPTSATVAILRELANKIELRGVEDAPEFVRDFNGNRVGTVSVHEE